MASLPKELRRQLENAVKRARRVADGGARKALEGLGVAHQKPWSSMSAGDRNLRSRLRAHGRQLGDKLDTAKGTQTVSRLASEVGYEHWHRMLFARFLAECDLLIEPKSGVAVSIDEVRELAREQCADWIELASAWAQRMLPQIFRSGDPVLEVSLPPETRQELESILEALPREIFVADDSLGWVYQFWQAERKDEINASETKIGADELPAVTQLFTEDYMVLFLLHNTLGAWWAGRVLDATPELAKTAKSEDELRAACKVGDIEWTYLRFVRDGDDGPWRPAAGTLDGWPKNASEIRVLDPCMGSGHFLVFALPIIAAFRMREEKLSREDAVCAVLRDNLHGLEIDPRCTQIAAFNLALAAWRMAGHRTLLSLNLACSGLGINTKEDDWLRLTPKNGREREAMKELYRLFAQAPVLGSLIDPRRVGGDLFTASFEKVRLLLEAALASEDTDEKLSELAVTAKGIVDASALLSSTFTLVATNVPYLGSAKQGEDLKDYCRLMHAAAKADLATCFVERCLAFCDVAGTVALVTPQNWIFLGTYKKLRRHLLREEEWNCVARLGEHAFDSPQAAGAFVVLLELTHRRSSPTNSTLGIDAAEEPTPNAKDGRLRDGEFQLLRQSRQLENPDSIVTLREAARSVLLETYATNHQGLSTGDNPRFRRVCWEVAKLGDVWASEQSAPEAVGAFRGRSGILKWEDGHGELWEFGRENVAALHNVDRRGEEAWGKSGVAIAQMRDLPATLYTGQHFDTSTAVLVPRTPKDLPALWSFCSSPAYCAAVRELNPKVSIDNGYLTKVPFDIAHWKRVASEQFPRGLPIPTSFDPTQWLFDGQPRTAEKPLQVSTARLLGYRWPRQTGSRFPGTPALQADGLARHADVDGIVCLTALKGESAATDRLLSLLADAFGSTWSPAKLNTLLAEVGFAGKSLEAWLRDDFFEQHCDLFHQRPFVWQIWDGVKDGFSALVNYHKLAAPSGEGRKTLEGLIYTYLGAWMERQRHDRKNGVEGSDLRLAAAEHLKNELEKILHGEPPYDVFARWKPLHQQPIGWEPDINDGVRINIRPFIMATPLSARGRNASILRVTPGIKWGKDRGKEPGRPKEDFPWFWGWDETTEDFAGGRTFDGNRWNDLHYTRDSKEAARERAATRHTKGHGHAKA